MPLTLQDLREQAKEKKISPMMLHYLQVKQQSPDTLVFYRLGDFYEMFFDDALIVSRELELTLTGRDCGLSERAPMCGVPYHSCESYIARLIERGYKVAICEQVEDPKAAKGLVKREVIRVITPGTILESNMLEEGKNNFIAVFYGDGEYCGCVFADISTGEARCCLLPMGLRRLQNELARFSPREILLGGSIAQEEQLRRFLTDQLGCAISAFDFSRIALSECAQILPAQFGAQNLELLQLGDKPQLQLALGALLQYLSDTQKHGIESLRSLELYNEEEFMNLDLTASRNLELTKTLRGGEKRGSLLWVLDHTKTAMGKRLLRAWLEKPLLSPQKLTRRLNAVDELFSSAVLCGELRESLSDIFDLERLISRIVFGNATPRELKSLESTLRRLPSLRSRLSGCRAQYLQEIYGGIDPLEDVAGLIGRAIEDEPPLALKDGGVIRAGFDGQLDELRSLVQGAKGYIAALEKKERERTGIKNLKVGYNHVFGYYFEVTKSNLPLVPQDYIRKQTLANAERYITEQLKELEQRILTAGEQIERVEAALYQKVRAEVCAQTARIQSTAAAIAQLDVYGCFAHVSAQNGYCRPQITLDGTIHIRSGRHPVVERMVRDAPFVCNDVLLDMGENRIAVITGPNMAGKSTYMRMTALIVLLAQVGCFVPAASAEISVVDGIYTRVGASDDLAAGQSTFMVEMSEVANILAAATKNSFIILDEIGRGTSTYDGMAIARAVVEYIADRKTLGAKTMFATHYHELTELEDTLSCVKNYNISVKRQGEDVIFLRRIVRGGADDSYGIYVSKLAGIPEAVVRRAQAVLRSLEQGKPSSARRVKRQPPEDGQIILQPAAEGEITRRLKETDPDNLTPVAALNLVCELKKLL